MHQVEHLVQLVGDQGVSHLHQREDAVDVQPHSGLEGAHLPCLLHHLACRCPAQFHANANRNHLKIRHHVFT